MLCGKYENLRRLAVHFGLKGSDAEDAAQEIFILAYTNLHQLRDVEKMDSWLYKIAMRYIHRIHKVNRARREKELHYEDCFEQLEKKSVCLYREEKLKTEIKEEASEMMAALSGPAAEIIRLYYEVGLTLKEISVRLQMNYNSVKTIKRRAFQKLAEENVAKRPGKR